ncbi:MAG: protein kinase, partial [Thermoguttaceae bacterium]
QSNPEFCPPELALDTAIELPAGIEAATAILRQRGLAIDPRRVDVYQFGVLLCQLLTGEPLLSYRYSTTVKAKVPPMARAVLDRCLGEGATAPLAECEDLIEALDELLRQCADELPPSIRETPVHGSGVPILAETPPRGSAVVAPAENSAVEELPFAQLGHFQIVQRIGSGGMGDVYKGYDASLDRYVAIKVLPATLARDEDFVRRFQAEATAVAKLAHPNVVRIHFIGNDAGHHFFAMQFIEGESLGKLLARQRRLPLQQAVAIVEQCLAGLEAAHAQGLVHRDVKPGNVLLDRGAPSTLGRGQAVLVDFGLVRQMKTAAQMTATGVVMGTVDYIAPEQARGRKIDGRSDIYSLGVMYYQMLAGRLPYSAETPTAMIFQHAYEKPFPLTQAAPDVPQPVIQVIARMMAKDPAERYGSCAAVLADLRAFREGRPLEAAPASEISAPASEPINQPAEGNANRVSNTRPDRQTYPAPLSPLPPDTPWQRAKDWVATMFRRHAPHGFQELRSTTHRVDGAVAEHERRLKRLTGLVDEARGVVAALAVQIEATEKAAQDLDAQASKAPNTEAFSDKLRACREDLAALHAQHDAQQEQVGQLEIELAKAEVTLVRLQSQRDLFNARMKAVEARQRAEGTAASHVDRFRWDWKKLLVVAGITAIVLGTLYSLRHVGKIRIPPQAATAIAPEPKPVNAAAAPERLPIPTKEVKPAPKKIADAPKAIVAAASEQDKLVRPLPGAVADIVVGGGGRYLILRLAGQQQLAVFDVPLAKVIKQIPLAEQNVYIAAGTERLVVIFPDAKLLQIWNLSTLQRERSVLLPENVSSRPINQICMGSASTGTLFIYLPSEKRTLAMDIDSLSLAITQVNWSNWSPTNAYGPLQMRAAPDGSVLIGWGGGWAGCELAFFDKGKQTGSNPNVGFWAFNGSFGLPSADGR